MAVDDRADDDANVLRFSAAQFRQARKNQMTGVLAHEFNNLLMPILAHTELLQEKIAGRQDLSAHVDMIYQSAEMAKDLVADVLSFARPLDDEKTWLDLSIMVKEIPAILEPTLPHGVVIETRCAADCPRVYGDPVGLRQMVMNLCTNAAFAMKDTGGRLLLSLDPDDLQTETGGSLKLEVSDSGVGISAEMLDSIFEPFVTTKGHQGSGLGLALVYGVVKNHQGDIYVGSSEGEGSTFTVFLPTGKPD